MNYVIRIDRTTLSDSSVRQLPTHKYGSLVHPALLPDIRARFQSSFYVYLRNPFQPPFAQHSHHRLFPFLLVSFSQDVAPDFNPFSSSTSISVNGMLEISTNEMSDVGETTALKCIWSTKSAQGLFVDRLCCMQLGQDSAL